MPLPLPLTVIDGRDATEIPPDTPDAEGIGENMAGTRRRGDCRASTDILER
jgi:hypothetical protein